MYIDKNKNKENPKDPTNQKITIGLLGLVLTISMILSIDTLTMEQKTYAVKPQIPQSGCDSDTDSDCFPGDRPIVAKDGSNTSTKNRDPSNTLRTLDNEDALSYTCKKYPPDDGNALRFFKRCDE